MITSNYNESTDGTIDPILKKKKLNNSIYGDQPKEEEVAKAKTPTKTDTAVANMPTSTGDSGMGSSIASGAVQAFGAVYSRESQGPLNRRQRNASTAALTAQGASIGTAISPGWGTLIGAVVGAGYGAIKGSSDAKKLRKKAKRDKIEAFDNARTSREAAQKLQDGERSTAIPLNTSGIQSNYNIK
jgi:hypothetical protein